MSAQQRSGAMASSEHKATAFNLTAGSGLQHAFEEGVEDFPDLDATSRDTPAASTARKADPEKDLSTPYDGVYYLGDIEAVSAPLGVHSLSANPSRKVADVVHPYTHVLALLLALNEAYLTDFHKWTSKLIGGFFPERMAERCAELVAITNKKYKRSVLVDAGTMLKQNRARTWDIIDSFARFTFPEPVGETPLTGMLVRELLLNQAEFWVSAPRRADDEMFFKGIPFRKQLTCLGVLDLGLMCLLVGVQYNTMWVFNPYPCVADPELKRLGVTAGPGDDMAPMAATLMSFRTKEEFDWYIQLMITQTADVRRHWKRGDAALHICMGHKHAQEAGREAAAIRRVCASRSRKAEVQETKRLP
jgi:hypothetical protein